MRHSLPKRLARAALSLTAVSGVVLAASPLVERIYGANRQNALQAQWQQAKQSDLAQDAIPPEKSASPKTTRQPSAKRLVPPRRAPRWEPTRLVIPGIDLDAVVVRGVSEAALREGPGHDSASSLPGQLGNCIIAAHRNSWGWWFYRLNRLPTGSPIYLKTPRRTLTYRVALQRTVAESDVRLLKKRNGSRLVLYTCALPHGSDRIVVVANLVS